jgi:hypothetical protein
MPASAKWVREGILAKYVKAAAPKKKATAKKTVTKAKAASKSKSEAKKPVKKAVVKSKSSVKSKRK